MYLAEIAASIVEAITTSLPENWGGGLVLPGDLPVLVDELDPLSNTDNTDAGVYVIPGFNEFDLTRLRTAGRNETVQVSVIKYVTVAICVPFSYRFDTTSVHSVTPKAEWSLLSNLREDLELFLIRTPIGSVKLVSIESQVPDELALDNRLYMVPITAGYRCK
jgi:hypothetical protein